MVDKDDFLECLDIALLTQDISAPQPSDALAAKNDLFLYLEEVSTPSELLADISVFDLSININDSALGDDGFPQGTNALMYLLCRNKESIASALLDWILTEDGSAGRCLLGHQDSNGMSALMLAAQRGFMTIVKILAPYETCLQTHSKAHIKCSGTRPSAWVSGKTALMFAIEAGYFDVAITLSTYESGMFSVLERHVRNTDRTKVVFVDYSFALDIVESIPLDSSIATDIKNLSNALDLDRWMRAAVTKDIDRLTTMLPSFIGRTNGLGQTATMIACYKDQADSIRAMIRFCPKQFCELELNKRDIFDNKALCYATLMKAIACITLLSTYDESYCQIFPPHKPDARNIASRWCGKGLRSCLEYAQSIDFFEAYSLLSEPFHPCKRL